MKNFKVGDIVKGVEGSDYGVTNEDMLEARIESIGDDGRLNVVILEHIHPQWIGLRFWELKPKYFELVRREAIDSGDCNLEIRIYRDGNNVIAVNTVTGEKGIAKCSPEDEFNFEYGAKLAFRRLVSPKVGDKVKIVADNCYHKFYNGTILTISGVDDSGMCTKYYVKENPWRHITDRDFVKCTKDDLGYNGKVVCITTYFTELFRVGKIYTFKDGRVTYENGEMSSGICKSFADVEKEFVSKFIEIVE